MIKAARYLIVCVLMFYGASTSYASVEKTFSDANDSYRSGSYADASRMYEEILASGYRSGELFYDLGNSYQKQGLTGKAILNYEKARLFIPRDSDLISNYRFALKGMKQPDPVNPDPKAIVFEFMYKPFRFMTLTETWVVVIILYYLTMIFFIYSMILKKIRSYSNIILSILISVTVLSVSPLKRKQFESTKAAIITTRITDARFEPLPVSSTNFPLYEGMKVFILREEDGWVKIKRTDGKIGWVETGNIGKVSV